MNVKTSSSGPIVTLVTTGDDIAARETLYGLTPPVIVNPHGSQVLIVVVTLGVTTAGFVGAGGWQLVSPANNTYHIIYINTGPKNIPRAGNSRTVNVVEEVREPASVTDGVNDSEE